MLSQYISVTHNKAVPSAVFSITMDGSPKLPFCNFRIIKFASSFWSFCCSCCRCCCYYYCCCCFSNWKRTDKTSWRATTSALTCWRLRIWAKTRTEESRQPSRSGMQWSERGRKTRWACACTSGLAQVHIVYSLCVGLINFSITFHRSQTFLNMKRFAEQGIVASVPSLVRIFSSVTDFYSAALGIILRHFWVSKVITTAHARKIVSFFILFTNF